MNWAEKYIGREFGEGWDCWRLVVTVYRDQLNIDLPEYGAVSADQLMQIARLMTTESVTPIWTRVSKPKPFDVILMAGRVGGARVPLHVGVLIEDDRILHVEENTATVAVSAKHHSVRNRFVAAYRHVRMV